MKERIVEGQEYRNQENQEKRSVVYSREKSFSHKSQNREDEKIKGVEKIKRVVEIVHKK